MYIYIHIYISIHIIHMYYVYYIQTNLSIIKTEFINL